MLRGSSDARRLERKHVTTHIVVPRSRTPILAGGDIQRVHLRATPSRASHVSRWEVDISKVLARWVKAHDSVGCEDCDP